MIETIHLLVLNELLLGLGIITLLSVNGSSQTSLDSNSKYYE